VYGRIEGFGVSVMGRSGEAPHDPSAFPPTRPVGTDLMDPFLDDLLGEPLLFSATTLENVKIATVYAQEGRFSIRGVLFQYGNGASRALGECRVGVSPCRRYEKPKFLCALKTEIVVLPEVTYGGVQFEFSQDLDHSHKEEGWVCHSMSGVLQLWFSSLEVYYNVYNNGDV